MLHVVEFLATIRVLDVPPALAADTVVALVVAGDGRPLPRGFGILEVRHQTKPLEITAGCEAAQLDESRIDVEQFGRADAALGGCDSRPREDQRHACRAVPQRILAADALFPEMVAVVAPDHDDCVVGKAGFIQGVQEPADLSIHEACAGEVRTHEVPPFVVLLEPFQTRFR